ncbi:MAG: hypothetical protein AAF525_14505 [Pseudomonadota bacterium]
MSNDPLEALWHLHQNPGHPPESSLMSTSLDLDEGQALQLQLLERWLNEGETLGGWKIGMTSGASRNAMGEGIRPFGFVLKSRIKSDGDRLPLADLFNGGVENELCFEIGTSMGAGTTAADARQGVSGVSPGFEINQKRLPGDADAGLRVADDLSNWGIVAGDLKPLPSSLDDLSVTLNKNGEALETVASEGHIDDHFESLAILANRLADFGHSLEPGHRVITGAYARTPFDAGVYRGDFQNLGSVQIELTEAA